MELDKRILEGKKPLDCFDTEQAWQFMGKQCYFSNDARDFMDLDKADGDSSFYIAALQHIWTAEEYCFADNNNDFCFILPLDWVEPEEHEKKYRAFSLNEFLEKYDVGDLVKIRRNGYEEVEHAMFTGYITGPDESGDKNLGESQIIIGGMRYSFAYLFEYYELFFMGHWHPFGVIDE